jgi:hypothetical protein
LRVESIRQKRKPAIAGRAAHRSKSEQKVACGKRALECSTTAQNTNTKKTSQQKLARIPQKKFQVYFFLMCSKVTDEFMGVLE